VSTRDLGQTESQGRSRAAANVIVEGVRAGSPGARAGLRVGDLIATFNGQPVSNSNHFSILVGETPPGWTVKLMIIRHGQTSELSVTPAL
jgi:S1-C subfamily serine protease